MRALAVAGLGILIVAACAESQTPLCDERPKRCVMVDSRDAQSGGATRYEVQLTNTCHEDVEYKLCFEVQGESADCRQAIVSPAERAVEWISLERFGGRTRVFLRYVREAKACRFPLTPEVRFPAG